MLERIAADLAGPGWSVCDNFIPAETVKALATECRQQWQRGQFRAAQVGIGENLKLRPEIRSDQVIWLDSSVLSPPQQIYFDAVEDVRYAVNQALYLGLFEFEAHLTLYPPGSFYRRHVDRFRGSEYRLVSCVLYLNENWLPEHGGQLRLHTPQHETKHVDIAPSAGALVCFLTEHMEHEVLLTHHDRLSVTGWLCARR